MSRRVLTRGSRLVCCHGGEIELPRGGGKVRSGGHAELTVNDLVGAPVRGCPLPTKACTKVVRVIDPGWQGTRVSGTTPVLETVIALTDSGPPGLCLVVDPGPPGAVHHSIGGLMNAPAPREVAVQRAAKEPASPADPKTTRQRFRLRLRLDTTTLGDEPGVRDALPASVKIFVTLVEGDRVTSLERSIQTGGLAPDRRRSGSDAQERRMVARCHRAVPRTRDW